MKTIGCLGIALLLIVAGGLCAAPAQSLKPQVLDGADMGKAETAIGDLIADAFRSAMHADVALVSAGDLRAVSVTVDPAGLKSTDLTPALMFPDDPLVVLALDGRRIRQALETSVSSSPKPSLSFLQVSGIKFAYDSSKQAGQRIVSCSIGSLPVVDDKSYTVAMLDSMAGGALGYWKVWSRRNVITTAYSSTCGAAIEDYLKSNPKTAPGVQGRITVQPDRS